MQSRLSSLGAMGAVVALLSGVPGGATGADLMSEPCAIAAGTSLETLESRRLALEETIAASREQSDAKLADRVLDAKTPTVDAPQISDDQGKLIDTLYQIECLSSDMERNEQVVRGAPATLTMSLIYATNRRQTDVKQLDEVYGSDDTRSLGYGTTTISIPSLHRPGELELPSLWKLEWSPNPDRHFVVQAITPMNDDEARSEIGERLARAKSKSLLLFVHGYNVSFREASFRTAQLAYDLRFPGVAMFYSWPSAGRTAGYLHDEESARLAVGIFDRLLDDLGSQKFQDVYVIAHSMGNRVVGEALARRVTDRKDVSKIRELMLAAPDINVELFKSDIAPLLGTLTATRKTIYASSRDVALKASNVVHGFPRLGDTRTGVFVDPAFDTIDASAAAPLLRSFGHSYVLDSSVVLNDVEDVIMWRRSLADRILRPRGVAPNLYWALR